MSNNLKTMLELKEAFQLIPTGPKKDDQKRVDLSTVDAIIKRQKIDKENEKDQSPVETGELVDYLRRLDMGNRVTPDELLLVIEKLNQD